MGMIELASFESICRGMDYYEMKKVISWKQTGDDTYEGVVSGNGDAAYDVHIDLKHPRRSTCSCPHAKGRQIICKHKMALYFTAVPGAADEFRKLLERWEREAEEEERRHLAELRRYVKSLKKAELQERLLEALLQIEELESRRWR